MAVQQRRGSRQGGRVIADMISAVKAGGVTVETPYNNQLGRLACRTVIQPDGDMMVYVDPRIESDSAEWVMHERETKARIRKMAVGVEALTNMVSFSIAAGMMVLLYSSGGMYGLETKVKLEVWGPIVGGLALQLGFARLFPQMVPQVLGWVLKTTSRRWKQLAGFEQRNDFLSRRSQGRS